MVKSRPMPRILKIATTDRIAFLGFLIIIIPVMWAVMHEMQFSWNLINSTSLGTLIIMWRARSIRKLWTVGTEVQATITHSVAKKKSRNLYRRRQLGGHISNYAHVKYTYEFRGKEYSGKCTILYPRSKEYNVGDEITLIVNPNKPKKTAIKNMYDGEL